MTVSFPPNSRYFGLETLAMTLPDGREVVYLAQRFVPQPERIEVQSVYTVIAGDRADIIAWRTLGDPELSWRLADANGAMRLEELTDSPVDGLKLKVPGAQTDR